MDQKFLFICLLFISVQKIKDHIDLNVTAIMWSIRVVFPLLCVDSTCCKVKTSTMPLEWLFGRKKTPEEMLRQNQRALNKAMRDLDRERAKMEQQEKKVIADIKNMAKKGQMVCRTMCPKWKHSYRMSFIMQVKYSCFLWHILLAW